MSEGKGKFFYGYVVVAAGIAIQLLVWGIYNSFGIFFKPMSDEFGWTRAVTSGAFSLAYVLFGIMSIATGRLSDRLGPKVILIACGLFLGLGYLLMSQVGSVWQLYLFYGLIMGAGMGGADVPILSAIARWFVKWRGMASGLVKTGAGIGIFAMPLVITWLISGYGWRSTFTVMGLLSVVGVILAALFLKHDPSDVGQLPDGDTKPVTADSKHGSYQFSLREALAIRQMWQMCIVWFLTVLCVQTVMIHIVLHVTDLGFSPAIAATMVSTIGGLSILGRIGMGNVADRIGSRKALLISLSFLAVGLVLLQFARELWLVYLFAVLNGIAHGAFFTLISPLMAELFGLRSLGATLGIVVFSGTLGGALGPFLAGYAFDLTGGYQIAFLGCLVLSLVDIGLIVTLRPPAKKPVAEYASAG